MKHQKIGDFFILPEGFFSVISPSVEQSIAQTRMKSTHKACPVPTNGGSGIGSRGQAGQKPTDSNQLAMPPSWAENTRF
jgi:hypothetical protein